MPFEAKFVQPVGSREQAPTQVDIDQHEIADIRAT